MTSKVRLAAKAKTTCHVIHALPYLFTKDLLHPNNRFLLQLIKPDYYRNGERKSASSDPGQLLFFSPKVSTRRVCFFLRKFVISFAH